MSAARRAYRWIRAQGYEWLGMNHAARRRLDGSRAALLMYHRVLPRDRAQRLAVEPGMFVTPQTFRNHLDWLEASFRVLPLGEVVTRLADRRPLPPGACAITFDDGWRDNFEHAFPELERRAMPATIFLVTERVGTRGAFWPDEVCRLLASLAASDRRKAADRIAAATRGDPAQAVLAALKMRPEAEREQALNALHEEYGLRSSSGRELLEWAEVEQMAASGVIDFECHGASHAILTGLTPEAMRDELERAARQLRERGHGCGRLLAYPSGAYDDEVTRTARSVGFRAAFTTLRGLASASVDALTLPRIGLHDDISATRAEFRSFVPGRSREASDA
jgi:peptidoglycan/xylan/chitin deacetylase (PgdA/CDA1 family)